MDEVEKWLVDYAQTLAGRDSELVERIASTWHDEGPEVLSKQYAGFTTQIALLESMRDLDKTRVEFLDAQVAALRKQVAELRRALDDRGERIKELGTQVAEWDALIEEERQAEIRRRDYAGSEYPEPSWPLENQPQLEDYIKRRSEEDWRGLIEERDALRGEVREVSIERDHVLALLAEAQEHAARTIPIQNEPYLGLATTEEMFRELISRFTVGADSLFQIKVAVQLAEILGGLSAKEKEYRTVED